MVGYTVEVGPSYTYRQVEIDSALMAVDSLIQLEDFRSRIKEGDRFDVHELFDARSSIVRQFRNNGYYYFNQDFLEFNADTTSAKHQIDLNLVRRRELTETELSKYSIGNIEIYLSGFSDSVGTEGQSFTHRDMRFHVQEDYLKPDIIADALYFGTGDLYTREAYQKTMSRLNGLGVFSYVRINYEPAEADSLGHLLDVRIDLHMAEEINLHLESDLVIKSTGFLGPGVKAGISHSNAFRGAELISVDLRGGLEWQWGKREESQIGTFSYELGINSALTFPKLLLTRAHFRNKDLWNRETSIHLNFDVLNRTQYYSMFSSQTSLKYSWGRSQATRHSFSPVYLNSVSLLATTPVFDSIVDENIYIRKSFEEQFIFGMRYDFTYDNTYRKQLHNLFYSVGASSSGTLLDLLSGVGKDASERPYQILNTVYSQHLKLTSDFRYYLNGFNKSLALRLYAGVGIPYLNSNVLPYVEQFFSGGAYSVRGFTARTLGPGSFYEETSNYIDQSGDIKLEANLEFRFGISRITKGALFIDTGNIWLHNEDENRPGSQFHFNTFYDQLAVGTGFGLRFDFNFFVLRADLGIPLRTPYVQDDSNWLAGTGNPLSRALFYFAIGYPF
jgi:outer membrane protein assembly factor BamA